MAKSINTQAAELLESAMTVFMIPGTWAKGALARRANGDEVDVSNPSACSFCSLGALDAARKALKVKPDVYNLAEATLHDEMMKDLRFTASDIADFNDKRNKKDPVVQAFAKAADELRGL